MEKWLMVSVWLGLGLTLNYLTNLQTTRTILYAGNRISNDNAVLSTYYVLWSHSFDRAVKAVVYW